MRRVLLITLISCFGTLTSHAATEVYKWVDENGQTHYGEKPSDENASKIKIRRPAGADSETVRRVEQREKLLQIYEEERQLKKQEDLKARQEQEKRKRQCSYARSRVEKLAIDVPLYRLDEKGERVYLSDKDRSSEKAYWQEQVTKFCEPS